jgi:uncharacterized protein (DUF885 family)
MSVRLKPVLKGLGGLFALALLALAVFLVNLVWFRPFSLNHFYEKVFVQVLLDEPELLTSIGIAEQFGYRAHNAHLGDVSIAKETRDFQRTRKDLATLTSYDLASQSPAQQLSTRVLTYFLQQVLDGEPFRFHDYPVNQHFGVQSSTPEFFISQHQLHDKRGAQDYLLRLGEVGRKFDQVMEGLEKRQALGVIPPKFVIEKVLLEMRDFAGKPAADNVLCTHFKTKLGEQKAPLPAAEQQALLRQCVAALDQGVLPAYRKLIGFFERQLNVATTDDGVWKLPQGEAYYAYRLRNQTTTDMTPEAVHTLGLAEVARIDADMRRILEDQGLIDKGETTAQAVARLQRDPKQLYPDTDEGRKAALAGYKAMIEQQLVLSRSLVGLVPKASIDVQRVPAFKEATAPLAYYIPPAMDGSRPGVFNVNLNDIRSMYQFGMRTLAVHEGVPGHHFQIALAQEQEGGPTFRKMLPFTAYAEGWALYAEWLASHAGLYKDEPLSDVGRLQSEMFRAVRLVVDTGIHHKRWTRQQAIDYMQQKTGMPQAEVVSEIERYIVDPGQACAYKVGMLSIMAARQRAEKALGAPLTGQAQKDFHDVILAGGALPLTLLDEQVDAWIASRKPK